MYTPRLLSYFSTTTLQILKQNKSKLTLHSIKPQINLSHNRKHLSLLQYNTINHQYLQSNRLDLTNKFKQLEVYKNKLKANQVLANGNQYDQYGLVKILNICLRKIQEESKLNVSEQGKKQWSKIQQRILQLFRNTSAIDNILLLYISANRFSVQLQNKIIHQVQQQYKGMSPMETQLLYYTLCHIQTPVTSPISPLINSIKTTLQSSVYKTKLTLPHLINWIILLSITNACNVSNMLLFYDKITKYDKYILSPQQLYSLLLCLNLRTNLADDNLVDLIKQAGYKMINWYYKKNINGDMLINAMKQKIRMKYLLDNYYPGNKQKCINISQINESLFTQSQILRYLHRQWKNDYLQQYQIKSLYQTLKFVHLQSTANQQKDDNKNSFKYVDIIHNICWLQLGLDLYRNHQLIITHTYNLQYIPKGLQWPLWNYLAQILKKKQTKKLQLKNQTLTKIQEIIIRIKKCNQNRKKQEKLKQQSQRLKKVKQIVQLQKFFHSIKAWSFGVCEQIAGLDFIVHFVNHEMKIIVHCLTQRDYIETQHNSKDTNQNKSENIKQLKSAENTNTNQYLQIQSQNKNKEKLLAKHQLNNEYILNKKLLKQNFGYQTIQIQMNQYLLMNYNQRIIWLRQRISAIRKIHGLIHNS